MLPETAVSAFHPFTNYDFSNFYFGSGDDVYDTIRTYNQWFEAAYAGGYHIYREPVTYPAVSKGKARFRLSVSASHTIDQLEYAAQTIAGVLKEAGILCK